MTRGPENVFGKAPGRFDEMVARRLARTLPEQALSACAAMSADEFTRFVALFNEVFAGSYGRPARIVEGGRPADVPSRPGRDA